MHHKRLVMKKRKVYPDTQELARKAQIGLGVLLNTISQKNNIKGGYSETTIDQDKNKTTL